MQKSVCKWVDSGTQDIATSLGATDAFCENKFLVKSWGQDVGQSKHYVNKTLRVALTTGSLHDVVLSKWRSVGALSVQS